MSAHEDEAALDAGENFDSLQEDADSSGMILVEEGTEEHNKIKTRLLSKTGDFSNDTTIVSIRKHSSNNVMAEAKFEAFRLYKEVVATKNGGDANVKYGFYAGSEEVIKSIFSDGFSRGDISRFANDDDSHGIGIHLVPSKFSLLAAEDTVPDEEGLRYLLLCRVIMGKSELIISGSKQWCPSSTEFVSGVDDLNDPKNYVIWCSEMNTHIFPCYIITFKSPRLREPEDSERPIGLDVEDSGSGDKYKFKN